MKQPTAEVMGVKTISTHQSYHGWPTICRLRNGELLIAVSAGRERHVCPFGQVHLLRSSDDGRTWSKPDVVANGPLDDRDAGIMQTSKGTVLLNWFTSIAWLRTLERAEKAGAEETATWDDGYLARARKMRNLITPEIIEKELQIWLLRSNDNGITWEPRLPMACGAPHAPIELTDGRLLAVGNPKAPDILNTSGAPYAPVLCAAESSDDGLTWQRLGDIPQRQGDPLGTYHEPHLAQAADGRIVVHIRNHSEQDKWHLLQSESTDGGRTFSIPRSTGLLGHPAHLLKLRDGRLLSTYGYRVVPFGNRASISDDNGKTWSKPMVLDEKPEPRDIGYPSTVEMPDGSMISAWYEVLPGDKLASLQAAHWTIKAS